MKYFRRLSFWAVLGILIIASVLGMLGVKTNYRMTDYLPESSPSIEGLKVMEEEFGSTSYARVMLKNVTVRSAYAIKQQISEVEGVSYMLWLDEIVEMLSQSLRSDPQFMAGIETVLEIVSDLAGQDEAKEFLQAVQRGDDTLALLGYVDRYSMLLDLMDIIIQHRFMGAMQFSSYYDPANMDALIQIYFEQDDYSTQTDAALESIMDILDKSGPQSYMDGSAVLAKSSRETTTREATMSTLYVIPLALLILFVATTSSFEPVLFMIAIGISVLFNMGSNILLQWAGILDGVSFITNSMAAALQMALSIDYFIFLLTRYRQEKETEPDRDKALRLAVKNSFSPVLASSLDSVAGFIAMSFMQFRIGMDIGLVFCKGILLSLLCVFVVMPPLIRLFDKPLEKFQHRNFLPSSKKLSTFTLKHGVIIVAAIAAAGAVSFSMQGNIDFYYGEATVGSGEGTPLHEAEQQISASFGSYNPYIILIPKNMRSSTLLDTDDEYKIITEIYNIKYQERRMINSVMAYRVFANGSNPLVTGFLPEEFQQSFDSDNYTRIMVNIDAPAESQPSFDVHRQIQKIISPHNTKQTRIYTTGGTALAADMKVAVEADYNFVNMLAIVATGAVIMFMFKSLILPFLLLFTIESGIMINMALSSFGSPIAFLGYLIVSLIQLGATIDYAILYSSYYIDHRRLHGKKLALEYSLRDSFPAILTSSGILCAAGATVWLASSVNAVSQIGLLIARGALINCLLTLLFLPPLMYMFDKYIQKFSIGMKFKNSGKDSDPDLPDDDEADSAGGTDITVSENGGGTAAPEIADDGKSPPQGSPVPAVLVKRQDNAE